MRNMPNWGLIDVLSEKDIQTIHRGSLNLLAELGVRCESEAILDVFKKGKAKVNLDSGVIHVSPDIVESALKTTPSSFALCGREPEKDLRMEQGRAYFAIGGSSEPFYYDYDRNQPRQSRKEDVADVTRVAQAAEDIDIIMAICMAGDVPREHSYKHEYDAVFRNTTKPVIWSAPSRTDTLTMIDMAIALSGSEKAFRERPWLGLYASTISPMEIGAYNDGVIDAVNMGIPIVVTAGANMGGTSPMTVAGSLLQMNAEGLFAIVFTQLVKPGAPVIDGVHAGAMDMSIGQLTYASPEQALYRAGLAQLGRFYNLPTFGFGGGVESKQPDAQAAAESMMAMFFNVLSGMTISMTLGTLASGFYGAAEMVLICDEMVRMIKRIVAGIDVDEEKLALDLIKEVGHGGEFVSREHTLKFFRQEQFLPRLFQRQGIDEWIERGSKSTAEVAHERVQEILSRPNPVQLSAEADRAMSQVLLKATQEN